MVAQVPIGSYPFTPPGHLMTPDVITQWWEALSTSPTTEIIPGLLLLYHTFAVACGLVGETGRTNGPLTGVYGHWRLLPEQP